MKTSNVLAAVGITSNALAQRQCIGCDNIANLALVKCSDPWTNQVLTCIEPPCNQVYSQDPWVQYCGRTVASIIGGSTAISVPSATTFPASTSSATVTSSATSTVILTTVISTAVATSTVTSIEISTPSPTTMATTRTTSSTSTTTAGSGASSNSAPSFVLFGILAVLGALRLV